MGAQGTTTVNFGAFPGSSHASVAVTGQASIVAGSLVEAWLRPEATADHTADEHLVEPIKVLASDIVAGVGFTIHAFNTNELIEQYDQSKLQGQAAPARWDTGRQPGSDVPNGGIDTHNKGTLLYGQFTVAWVWN